MNENTEKRDGTTILNRDAQKAGDLCVYRAVQQPYLRIFREVCHMLVRDQYVGGKKTILRVND